MPSPERINSLEPINNLEPTAAQPRATIVWSIAGSDNSAGAGIQADIKAVQSVSQPDAPLHLCTVITAITAQHSQGVDISWPLPVELLQAQVQALLKEAQPAVVKIGLLANPQQVRWLADVLAALRQSNADLLVVYDPVAIASSGDALSSGPIYATVSSDLLPQVDIVTPNLGELQALSGIANDNRAAVARLQQFGAKAVLLKGGHSDAAQATDVLFISSRFRFFGHGAYCPQISLSSNRLAHHNTHGTGCSFASLLAANLAGGYALEDAFVLTKYAMNQALALSVSTSAHSGCPGHYSLRYQAGYLPRLNMDVNAGDAAFAPLQAPLGLYVIVSSVSALKRALQAGVRTVQLRIKNAAPQLLRDAITQAIGLCQQAKAQLFINDHWQLALQLGAYGVHLGQEDIHQADLPALRRAGLRLGISCHGAYKLLLAEQLKPSYLAIGAIFSTTTKDMAGKIQGLSKLRHYALLFNTLPLVAIGGIDEQNAPAVLASGIRHLAVVSAFSNAAEPEAWVRRMQAMIKQADTTQQKETADVCYQ